jgi:hypothetical protein
MTIQFSLPVDAAASASVMAEPLHPLARHNVKEDNYLNFADSACYPLHQSPEGGLSQNAIQLFEITRDTRSPYPR